MHNPHAVCTVFHTIAESAIKIKCLFSGGGGCGGQGDDLLDDDDLWWLVAVPSAAVTVAAAVTAAVSAGVVRVRTVVVSAATTVVMSVVLVVVVVGGAEHVTVRAVIVYLVVLVDGHVVYTWLVSISTTLVVPILSSRHGNTCHQAESNVSIHVSEITVQEHWENVPSSPKSRYKLPC